MAETSWCFRSYPLFCENSQAVQNENVDTLRFQKRIACFDETLYLNTVEKVWFEKRGTMKSDFMGEQRLED